MSKPVIGISTYREDADWGSWQAVRADLLPAAYADSVLAGGGIPILLPPHSDPASARDVVARVDGLIIAGGADVDPGSYRAQPGAHTAGWRADRDASELALLDAAASLGIPMLGICRGMQMMAVHGGGTLLQHVPDEVGHERHSPGPGTYGPIEVGTVAGTAVAGILGERVTVPCHHHQAVATHPGLAATARAADGIVEALEDPSRPFWMGVQWHPEVGTDMRLFAAVVAAAAAHRALPA